MPLLKWNVSTRLYVASHSVSAVSCIYSDVQNRHICQTCYVTLSYIPNIFGIRNVLCVFWVVAVALEMF